MNNLTRNWWGFWQWWTPGEMNLVCCSVKSMKFNRERQMVPGFCNTAKNEFRTASKRVSRQCKYHSFGFWGKVARVSNIWSWINGMPNCCYQESSFDSLKSQYTSICVSERGLLHWAVSKKKSIDHYNGQVPLPSISCFLRVIEILFASLSLLFEILTLLLMDLASRFPYFCLPRCWAKHQKNDGFHFRYLQESSWAFFFKERARQLQFLISQQLRQR